METRAVPASDLAPTEYLEGNLTPAPIDQGNCYRCGKPLGNICPALFVLERDGRREQKKLCSECHEWFVVFSFDSIKPPEGV